MDRISSVDDMMGTASFWTTESSGPKSTMNRSASEFAFQEFLKETLVAGGERAKSRFKAESEVGEEDQKPEVPMFASTEELRAMNNVVDSVAEDDEVAVIEGALNPLFSGMQDTGEKSYGEFNTSAAANGSGQDYEVFLKQKLEIACAAAALSRVRTSFDSLTCMVLGLVFVFGQSFEVLRFWSLLDLPEP